MGVGYMKLNFGLHYDFYVTIFVTYIVISANVIVKTRALALYVH